MKKHSDFLKKYPKYSGELYAFIGIIVIIVMFVLFAITVILSLFVPQIDLASSKAIAWTDVALSLVGGVVMFNLISPGERYDFFEKPGKDSIFYKARIFVILYFVMCLCEIALLIMLSS